MNESNKIIVPYNEELCKDIQAWAMDVMKNRDAEYWDKRVTILKSRETSAEKRV